jgi:hypothetical protein
MPPQPTRRDRLQVIFAFLTIFGGAMFVVSPDPNRAQTVFRIAIVVVGLAGLAWLNLRRRG